MDVWSWDIQLLSDMSSSSVSIEDPVSFNMTLELIIKDAGFWINAFQDDNFS